MAKRYLMNRSHQRYQYKEIVNVLECRLFKLRLIVTNFNKDLGTARTGIIIELK